MDHSIAIIGMAGRFPGASSLDDFWEIISSGRETVTAEGIASGAAGVLADVENFDASFFEMSPAEAEMTDPQHRVFLECCVEALDDAGYPAGTGHTATGVFAGCSASNYLLNHLQSGLDYHGRVDELLPLIGNDKDYLATRVSYLLDLKGPSISVQTACSTSLVAVHLACQSLLTAESDIALAGGVSIRVPQTAGYAPQEGGVLSPRGHCRPFDFGADGTVFGSGAACVVLKRLDRAIEDGDRIHAVIRGSAINNDGAVKAGFTAPALEGQVRVITEAMAVADVDPSQVSYVECHGTGTALGDSVEVAALTRAFDLHVDQQCALGSVKANIGHLENAAGVTGLIKTVLCLRNRLLPPLCNFIEPNPELRLERTPFYANQLLRPWTNNKRIAGVSSFGIGGTNAHVVVEEWPEESTGDEKDELFVLSARDENGKKELADKFKNYLEQQNGDGWERITWTAAAKRKHYPTRLALVARNREEAAEKLRSWNVSEGEGREELKIVFAYGGQGGQWKGMGQQLLNEEKSFAARVSEIDEAVRAQLGWSVREHLERGEEVDSDRIEITQVALFTVQAGLTEMWRSWGVEPQAVIGHSLGEVAAAEAAGMLSIVDAVEIVGQRSKQLENAVGRGGMFACELTAEEAQEWIGGRDLEIAAYNGPRWVVLSGASDASEKAAEEIERSGRVVRRLRTTGVAGHSSQVEKASEELRRQLRERIGNKGRLPMMSTVSEGWVKGDELGSQYWQKNLRQPVRFVQGITRLVEYGYTAFLEVGAHPVLSASIAESAAAFGKQVHVFETLRREQGRRCDLLAAAGSLWAIGQKLNWDCVLGPAKRPVSLPAYPWQRSRFWCDSKNSATRNIDLPGIYSNCSFQPSAHVWNLDRIPRDLWDGHSIAGEAVLPASAYVELFNSAARNVRSGSTIVLRDFTIPRMLSGPALLNHPLQTVLIESKDGSFSATVSSQSENGQAWIVYATAGVEIDNRSQAEKQTIVVEDSEKTLSHADFYAQMARYGIDYEHSFRSIEKIMKNENTAVAAIAAQQRLKNISAARVAKLDCALQPLFALMDKPQWPVGASSIRIDGLSGGAGRSYVKLHSNNESLLADICLTNDSGVVEVSIEGLRFAPMNMRMALPPSYRIDWTTGPSLNKTKIRRGSWLLIGEADSLQNLSQCLRRNGNSVTISSSLDDSSLTRWTGVVYYPHSGVAASKILANATELIRRFDNGHLWFLIDSAPEAIVLKGFQRVALTERPELSCNVIEVPNGIADNIEVITSELESGPENEEVYLHKDIRRLARLRQAPTQLSDSLTLRPDRTYLITGGYGSLGQLTAEHLIECGARHIALLGRRKKEIPYIPAVDGHEISTYQQVVDVADGVSLQRSLDELSTFAPPLAGVVHAAGHLEDGMIDLIVEAQITRVLAPKVNGALNLSKLIDCRSLDFLIFYSSVAALIGSPGQAAHAAANSFLDSFAVSLQKKGIPAISINWGPWAESGQAADKIDTLASRGLAAIEADRAFAAFDTAAVEKLPNCSSFDFDLNQWISYYPHIRSLPLFADLAANRKGKNSLSCDQLKHLPERWQRIQAVSQVVTTEASLVLRVAESSLDAKRPLRDVGLDSLRSFELRNRLQYRLGIKVPATALWRQPTIQDFSQWVLQAMGLEEEPITASSTLNLEDQLDLLERQLRG